MSVEDFPDNFETSQSQESTPWDDLKNVPFRGDSDPSSEPLAEAETPKSPEDILLEPEKPEEPGESRLDRAENAVDNISQMNLNIADPEGFFITGEPGPDDSPEDIAKLTAILDEYVDATIEDIANGNRRLKRLQEFGQLMGGRYAEREFGETTVGNIAKFYDIVETNGFETAEEGKEFTRFSLGDHRVGFEHRPVDLDLACYESHVTDHDIRAAIDFLETSDEEPSPALARHAIARAIVSSVERRINSIEPEESADSWTGEWGTMKPSSELLGRTAIDLLDETLTDEEILASEPLLSALKTEFKSCIKEQDSLFGDHKVRDALGSEHIFAVAMPHLAETGQLDDIDPAEIQAYGDYLSKQNLYLVNDDELGPPEKRCENITWLTKIGYDPFAGDLEGIITNFALQDTLHQSGAISPENADRLYHATVRLMRETGASFTLDTDIEPSGNDPVAVFWQKNAHELFSIFNDLSYRGRGTREENCRALLTEDGMPSDLFLSELADRVNFESELSDDGFNDMARFVVNNLELYRGQETALFNGAFKYWMKPEDRPTSELTEQQSAVFESYLSCETVALRNDLKSYLFDSHDKRITTDGFTRREYRYESFTPDQIALLPKVLQPLVETESNTLQDMRHATINWLFESGAPNPEETVKGIVELFESGRTDEIAANFPGFDKELFKHFLHKEDLPEDAELTDSQSYVLNKYLKFRENSPEKARSFRDFLCDKIIDDEETGAFHYRYSGMSPEGIDKCSDILTLLYDSNSSELSHLAPQIAEKLLTSDPETAEVKIHELEDIFLKKDLPDFAKLYQCANVLFEGNIKNESDISPVLKASENTHKVLLTNLLKVSIASNNRSLRHYLETAATKTSDDSGFGAEFSTLAESLGYDSPASVLAAMDAYHAEREAVHLDSIEERDGAFYLKTPIHEGDLIKGINSDFLHTLIQNGFNCPEMIGDSSSQDVTHWDADFGTARPELSNSLKQAIENSLASGYGDGLYVVVRDDERFHHTAPGDPQGYSDPTKYEAYHGEANGESFRGIRTGLGSEDVDFYVTKLPASKHVLRLKYELAKNGTYVPIVDKDSERVIFTPDEFRALRASFGGEPRYGLTGEQGTDLDEFHFAPNLTLPDTLSFTPNSTDDTEPTPIELTHKFSELVADFDEKERETREMQEKVTAKLLAAIAASDLPENVKRVFENYRTHLSEDAQPGSVDSLSTGSTGRFTNNPGDADFDFVWRIDRAILSQYKTQIMTALTTSTPDRPAAVSGFGEKGGLTDKGLRQGIVEININGETVPVEVDISPITKTDKLDYSSDQALEHRFEVIRAQDPEKYKQVIANIVIAKQILKAGHAYKKGSYADGGLGGIGVENWILQHGGSLVSAAQSFLAAARPAGGKQLEFDEFKNVYSVFDLGENHFSDGFYPFDNFVAANMTAQGYQNMLDVCAQIVL